MPYLQSCEYLCIISSINLLVKFSCSELEGALILALVYDSSFVASVYWQLLCDVEALVFLIADLELVVAFDSLVLLDDLAGRELLGLDVLILFGSIH